MANAVDTTTDNGTTDLAAYTPDIDQEWLNATVTFDEALAEAQKAGLSESDMVVVSNPYIVLNKDKDVLLDKPFFVKLVRFTTDAETGNPFAILYAIAQDNSMYVITDGSKGIFTQAQAIVKQRIKDGNPTPFQNWLVANGLRKSEYPLGVDNLPLTKADIQAGVKPSGKGVTYYLA